MDIDAQIQEILLRSSPVNDNNSQMDKISQINNSNSHLPPTNSGISVVGDKNIVINANLIPAILTLIILTSLISYMN